MERQGGGHNGSPPSMVPGGEWRGSLSGEEEVEVEDGEMEEEEGEEEMMEMEEMEGETSETVGQWKIKPEGRKMRSIYSVKQS